jgi:hypothetical protein
MANCLAYAMPSPPDVDMLATGARQRRTRDNSESVVTAGRDRQLYVERHPFGEPPEQAEPRRHIRGSHETASGARDLGTPRKPSWPACSGETDLRRVFCVDAGRSA